MGALQQIIHPKFDPHDSKLHHRILQALCGSLVALHLVTLYRISSQFDELIVVGLFWAVFFQRLKIHQENPTDHRNLLSALVAYLLIACLLTRSLSFYWFDPTFLNLMPFLIVLSVALLMLGWRVWKFSVELLFCATLLIPVDFLQNWFAQGPGLPLQILTAKVSSFALYYLGSPVITQGTIIRLPQGAVNVELGCTSFAVIFSLSQIWFLLVLMMPLSRQALLWVFGLVFGMTHLVTVFRVAFLAFVVDQPEIFSFWHDDQGQQIISTFLILFLGLTYYYFYLRELNDLHDLKADYDSH